ncbi:MAG: alkaline phosphatase PhoX [Acidimicrobiales bacterium]
MALPDGYTYRSLGLTGSIMSDGAATPGRQDGMAAFRGPRGTIRVVRNHEVRGEGTPMGGSPADIAKAYDGNTLGGTSTLEIDQKSRELTADWVSLTGTAVNCAGGPTPWGTWISCEETVNGPDLGPDFTGSDGPASFERHGYVYEVDPSWGPSEMATAVPVRNAGRIAHEAVAYDRNTRALYQTEDNFEFPSGIYRYLPPDNPMQTKRLSDGGQLEMLRVVGSPCAELGLVQGTGSSFAVDWVAIDQPDFDFGDGAGVDNDTGIQVVGQQGFAQGAAKFARPEGMWERAGLIYFTCTRGGATQLDGNRFGEYGNGFGQVWVLDPRSNELTLIFESPGPDVLDLPDNMTLSARGNIILCEDGSTDNLIRCLTPDGELFDFAQNMIAGEERQEFAGACFSPDNKTLFVNIQFANGLTFAIWREHGGTFL